jgi:peptide/nickel transport system substrate-binding protein
MRGVVFSLLLLMLFPAITQAKSEPVKDTRYGGTLVWGVYNKPTIINPLFTTQSISAPLQALIFNGLIRLDAQGDLEPDLAKSWGISGDGLVYTFHLREGVRFHDGIECTAYDVKFTFDTIIDPRVNSPFSSFFQLVKEFKAIDRYTFQVVLAKPSTSFIYRLIRDIIPKHLLEKTDLKNTPFNFKPMGTGPFKFKGWAKDNQLTLEYNPDYYEGRPYLDSIIVKTYADSKELWTALMRQEVDLSLFIEKDEYELIKKDPVFKTYHFPADYYYAIVYNLDDPIVADKNVRQAIAYGIDRKSLIEKGGFGYGIECVGPFYPGSIGFNPQVEALEFNPDKATALLSAAGWKDLNKEGILEKDGQDLEIRMLVDERNEAYQRLAMLIRQELGQIGIKLTVQLYKDDSILIEEFLRQNKSQAQLTLLPSGVTPDQEEREWSSQEVSGVYSVWKYKNEEVKRYFALGKTVNDAKKKEWIYQEIHRFIYKDQPACFLYFPLCFHAISSKFEDVDELFTLSMPHHTMRKWFVKQKDTR